MIGRVNKSRGDVRMYNNIHFAYIASLIYFTQKFCYKTFRIEKSLYKKYVIKMLLQNVLDKNCVSITRL